MQRTSLTILIVLFVTCFVMQAAAVPLSSEMHAQIAEKYPDGLPKYTTDEEKLLPLPTVSREDYLLRSPPTGEVHCSAEYESMEGLLIAWESYTSTLTSMIVPMTTHANPATAFVVVDNSSEQSSVYGSLSGSGADMDHVEFIVRSTDTVWIRDYGPRFIFEDGNRAIIDHTYNRPRPNDNLLNDYISTLWGEPQYDIPLTHGGGNFHLLSNGDAFMSDLILTENPGLSEQDVKDLYAEYQNLDLTIYPGFPTSFDSTQHIDMWMLPVGDDKVIIGQYSVGAGQPYTITEDAVTDLEARGYTVYRTPGWNSGGTHYTYTNAVIVNDLVFVPTFSGYSSENAEAQAVFADAMPGQTIIPVDCSTIIHAAGAMHCIVMHVPAEDGGTALTVTLPDGVPEYIPPGEPTDITVQIDDGSETYVPGSGTLYYRYDGGTFLTDSLTSLGGNLYAATLPAPACDDTPEFYISADGDGGTTVYSPEDAPASYYTTGVGTVTVILDDDFETDQGWTVEDVGPDPPINGSWERDVPVDEPNEDYHPPRSDYDGSGQCYLTENLLGNSDVDLGPTRLISPTFDLSEATDPILRFAYWWWNDDQDGDPMEVEISNDDGATWIPVQTIANVPPEWFQQEIHIASAIDPEPLTALMKVRFSVMDDPNNSKDEGGIDAVEVFEVDCQTFGDIDGDGDVDLDDYAEFEDCMTGPCAVPPCDPPLYAELDCHLADFEDDGDVDLEDFATFERSLVP